MNVLALPTSSLSPMGFFRGPGTDYLKGPWQVPGLLQVPSVLRSAATDAALVGQVPNPTVAVSAKTTGMVMQVVPQPVSFEEKVFDSLVSLKVAMSLYAMHIPPVERKRIFDRLDEVINFDDWHEEDTFPTRASFINFLKWIIFCKTYSWSSIGVADNGNILVAWTQPGLTLTANFFPQNKVTWTATVESESGAAHTAGSGLLQHFAKQALFYLSGGAAA